MADTTHSSEDTQEGGGQRRRDFLTLATIAVGAWGVGSFVYPFVNMLRPADDTLALASIEVDLSPLSAGQAMTVTWRGKPIFVRHRTEQEIEKARSVDPATLRDPASDESRVEKAPWLVMIGICTHLGCIPLGQGEGDPTGDYGGWFCPCHGSHYDESGRVRKGPAPENLEIPPYKFTAEKVIQIG